MCMFRVQQAVSFRSFGTAGLGICSCEFASIFASLRTSLLDPPTVLFSPILPARSWLAMALLTAVGYCIVQVYSTPMTVSATVLVPVPVGRSRCAVYYSYTLSNEPITLLPLQL